MVKVNYDTELSVHISMKRHTTASFCMWCPQISLLKSLRRVLSLHVHAESSPVANLRANDCPAKDEEISDIRIFMSFYIKENFSSYVGH